MVTEAFSPSFWDLAPKEATISVIHGGYIFTEGPMWHSREKYLVWTDIIGDAIWKWTPGVGTSLLMSPAGHADGLFIDREGRIVVAGWGNRSIWRIEDDGATTTLASHYEGKKLNTPNDLVVKSDGTIYWTDMSGALRLPGHNDGDVQKYLDFEGVYRLDPESGAITLLVDDLTAPNGLCFSPDESKLYVNNTRPGQIHVWDMHDDGTISNRQMFAEFGDDTGYPDGMKCDELGNVWCTAPGGAWVFDPAGNRLGGIKVPEHLANLQFGGDDLKTIYLTARTSVYAVTVDVAGIPTPV